MNIILLSGGSGQRLWPLSNDIRSKQFIKLFKNEQGQLESMLQRVYHQIISVDPQADITIATGKKQVSTIKHQLGDAVSVCVEPARRDTFPAIALASSFLHDKRNVKRDEVVLVCPVDPYVDIDYFRALKKLSDLAERSTENILLMGVEPTYPSEKYGYIFPNDSGADSKVSCFKEKPTVAQAIDYIRQGALWNCGVFAFKLGYMLDCIEARFHTTDHVTLQANYEELEKISFDYAVVEKEPEIRVMRFSGAWKDIGTWNTLASAMSNPVIGNAILNDTCSGTTVLNELNLPILCMGLKDVVVAASNDGILISDKEQSSYIKPYVDALNKQAMYAEKSWGSYTVLDASENSMTIKVTLKEDNRMHYHSHENRDEVWTILSGEGIVVLDDVQRHVSAGDVIQMPAGCKHTLIAKTSVEAIEVQTGEDITVHDKQKFELVI